MAAKKKKSEPSQVTDIKTRIHPIAPRKLTALEKALIKAKGDVTKIPGWQGGRGTE